VDKGSRATVKPKSDISPELQSTCVPEDLFKCSGRCWRSTRQRSGDVLLDLGALDVPLDPTTASSFQPPY